MSNTVLDQPTWRDRQRAHAERVDGWLGEHLSRRRDGRKHPVEDFLFTYYSHRPGQLRRWHPGAGTVLVGADSREFGPDYRMAESGLILDVDRILARRGDSIRWIDRLLRSIAARAPQLGCYGMHEWAMVYQLPADQVRHAAWPLRLSTAATAALVETAGVRCSHFDAFRFFTPAARPRNALQPTRDRQIELEQPGCLHANMDLYKWAYKLSPLVSSELVADCFVLAKEIRTLDMRASPYDLADLGYPPVPVETAAGRAEYRRLQRDFAERTAVLRARLIDELGLVLLQDVDRSGHD